MRAKIHKTSSQLNGEGRVRRMMATCVIQKSVLSYISDAASRIYLEAA